ncbi:MAG TPA: TlpA disulfide reductase family protein [Vicinamibacterales bacterium]|nr:TlpA disulfide reductase family protein [Vicinamibacterales bacterium]
MTRKLTVSVLVVAFATVAWAGQASTLIPDVRKAIAAKDAGRVDQLLTTFKAQHGVTSEWLAALSWRARGALADRQLDAAERYATETAELAQPLLRKGSVDQDAHLPIAVGAAIEVLAQVNAARGARTDALVFLQNERQRYGGTSIEKRIQKNINLLSLEGTVAPPLDLADYLGAPPPPLAQLKGKVVLLFFWAHWCSDCKAQAPILAELASRYAAQGLVVMAPTQRFGYVAGGRPATAQEEASYIDEIRQRTYAVLHDQSIPLSEANHRRYGVSSTPTLVLLDREGVVRLYHPGRMTLQDLEPVIKRLVTGATR